MTKKAFIFVAFMLISVMISARVNYAIPTNAYLPDDTTKTVAKKIQATTIYSPKDTTGSKKKFVQCRRGDRC